MKTEREHYERVLKSATTAGACQYHIERILELLAERDRLREGFDKVLRWLHGSVGCDPKCERELHVYSEAQVTDE